jgi:hypothetical protein
MIKKQAILVRKREIFLRKVEEKTYDLTLYSPINHVRLKRIYVKRLKQLLTYNRHYTKIYKFCQWKKCEFVYIFPIEIVKLYAEYLGCNYVKLLESSAKVSLENQNSERGLF